MVSRLKLASLGLALFACAPDAHPRCGSLGACDVGTEACQSAALAYAGCLRARNENVALPVTVSVVKRADFLAQRMATAASADTPLQRTFRRGLALFDLNPASSTVQDETDAYFDDVISMYESNPARITIVDDGRLWLHDSAILVHEMTHALQDAAGELSDTLTAPRYDAQLAHRAVNEGEATLAEDQTIAQGYGEDFSKLDYARALRGYRSYNSPYDLGFGGADIFSSFPERFAYAWGASYLWPLLDKQGPAAVAGAHATLPVSSSAVMELDPSQPLTDANDLGDRAVPVLPGFTLAATMHLGRYVYDNAMWVIGPSGFYYLPSGDHFTADTLSVFTAADGSVLAAWRFRFDDPALVSNAMTALANDKVVLASGFDGTDLWIVRAENAALLATLPSPLTWQAAPLADFALTNGPASGLACVRHEQVEE